MRVHVRVPEYVLVVRSRMRTAAPLKLNTGRGVMRLERGGRFAGAMDAVGVTRRNDGICCKLHVPHAHNNEDRDKNVLLRLHATAMRCGLRRRWFYGEDDATVWLLFVVSNSSNWNHRNVDGISL